MPEALSAITEYQGNARRSSGPGRNGHRSNGAPNGHAGNGQGSNSGSSLTGTAQPSSKPEVPIPGSHCRESGGWFDVGNDDFASQVLSRLPADLVYRSSGVVGRIIGQPGARKFVELNAVAMSLVIDEHLRLVSFQRDRKGVRRAVFTTAKREYGALVLEKASVAPSVRELRRLVRYPVYLRDFRVCTPGWRDGVFYDEPPALRGLQPETDTETIRQVIEDLVVDFPFKEPADKDNLVGLLLTPIVRPALTGNVPLHLIGASLERTGKSKLAEEVFGGVITGEPAAALQMTGSDDEVDKRVLSLLVEGETIAHLDNLGEFLDSKVLASLLTATSYKGRWLGANRMISAPNNLTIVATGNNVRATGELVKRTIPITLQPADDEPEKRTGFKHPDLRAYVAENRKRVIACLLGMVENWKACRRSAGKSPMGGFEAWARCVGGIMHVNGFHAWRANAEAWARSADERGQELRQFVAAWGEDRGEAWLNTAELAAIAKERNLFSSCFSGRTETGNLSSFARRALSPNVDRPVTPDPLNPSVRWIIRRDSGRNGTIYQLEGAPAGRQADALFGNNGAAHTPAG